MSETSIQRIREYLEKLGEPDSDKAVREIAAARLWQTGEAENQAMAEKNLGIFRHTPRRN